MFDVITRALRHPIDYSGIRRITTLYFQEKIRESDTTYSFIFSAPRLPKWRPGQHAILTLPGQSVSGKTWRPFSVAAAPHENLIRIGTTIPPEPSSFKQVLLNLKPGDRARMYGPYGELYLRPGMKKVVAVAVGIGITPFRAIIADMARERNSLDFHLIYSAKEEHVYKDDLENWQSQLPNLKITYTHAAEEVNAAIDKEVPMDNGNTTYMLSGAPGMINALCASLRQQGIQKQRILHDPFKGY